MYLVTIILPVLIGLSLASDPHAVQTGALAVNEGKTADDGTLDDDLDLAPANRDGQHNLTTNGTDGSERLVIEKDELKEANRSKPSDTALKWSRKQEKRQRKKTKLENGEKSLSEDKPAKSKKAKLNNGNDERLDGLKKKKSKKPIVTTERNPKTKTQISPMVRAMPQDKCPCRRWIPDWDYSVKNISANGTFDVNVCSKNDIPAVNQIVAYLRRVDDGIISGPATVINCIAHFEGVKNGTYDIQASALCPAYTIFIYGTEEICESGSKFSDRFVLFEPLKNHVVSEVSDRVVVLETDSIKPVVLGVVCGFAVIVTIIAVVCCVSKLIQRKRCRLSSQQSVELSSSSSSSHPPTNLEIMNPSDGSSELRNSWFTVYESDGDSLSPRESTLPVSPSQGETCHQCLARSPRPDHESTSNMQTTTFSENVADQPQSLGIFQKNGHATGRPLSDFPFSKINMPHNVPDRTIGIVNKPQDDVIKGPPVPLPDTLLSPRKCNNEKVSVKNPLSSSGADNMRRVETFHCVQNEHFRGEIEPMSSSDNGIVYDSDKDELVNSDEETLYKSDEDVTFRTEKYKLKSSGKKTTIYSSGKDAIHDTEKESLYVS